MFPCLLVTRHLVISNWHGCYSACLTICVGACVGCHGPSSGVPVWAAKVRVSPVASQCGAVSTKFFQLCSSVPCKYSLGGPVVSQCTLDQPVAFQWHSSVHCTSQCTLAQGKGYIFLFYDTPHPTDAIFAECVLRYITLDKNCTKGSFHSGNFPRSII